MKNFSLPEKHLVRPGHRFPVDLKQADTASAPMKKREWPLEVFLPIYLIEDMGREVCDTEGHALEQPGEQGGIGASDALLTGQDIVRFAPDFYQPDVSTSLTVNMPVNASWLLPAQAVRSEFPCAGIMDAAAEGVVELHDIHAGGEKRQPLSFPGPDGEMAFSMFLENRSGKTAFYEAEQKSGSPFFRYGVEFSKTQAIKKQDKLVRPLNPVFHARPFGMNDKEQQSGQFYVRLQKALKAAAGFCRQTGSSCFYWAKTFADKYGLSAPMKKTAQYMQSKGSIRAALAGMASGKGQERMWKKDFSPKAGRLQLLSPRAMLGKVRPETDAVIKYDRVGNAAAGNRKRHGITRLLHNGCERLRSHVGATAYGQA